MKCEYCGSEFEIRKGGSGRQPRYCSKECCREADKRNKRIRYIGKRLPECEVCGKPLPKYKTKYCSNQCYQVGEGRNKGKQIKICIICGKNFSTTRSNKTTCSEECKQKNLKEKTLERERRKYKENHPQSRAMEEIRENAQKKKQEAAERKLQRQQKLIKIKIKKEKEKLKKKDYWQHYSKLHVCDNCGQMYAAFYPKSQYCSKKCQLARYKRKNRYEGIIKDSGITLKKLAIRDKDICSLCHKEVDWNDFEIREDGTVICGDNYPSIDHVTPISKGGLHAWDNVQLAHRRCNTLKSNK